MWSGLYEVARHELQRKPKTTMGNNRVLYLMTNNLDPWMKEKSLTSVKGNVVELLACHDGDWTLACCAPKNQLGNQVLSGQISQPQVSFHANFTRVAIEPCSDRKSCYRVPDGDWQWTTRPQQSDLRDTHRLHSPQLANHFVVINGKSQSFIHHRSRCLDTSPQL